METHTSDAMELTMELVKINSTDPGAYETEIGQYVYDWLSGCGAPVKREEVLPGRANIMARIPGETDGPALIYICHMDTVTVGEGWTYPPFGAQVRGGRIYGRGACDMKSGLACAMSAFARIAKSGQKPRYPLALIATVDEEDFMRGAEAAIRSGWITAQDWVLDTEPTGGQIQVAHKGRLWFEVTVQGVTAHASTPWKGADAIAAMAEVITEIRRQVSLCPPHPDLGISTVTFGQIEGGYRPYVVPDSCKVWIDMRLTPPTDDQAAVKIVESAMAAASAKVPGIKASYEITGNRPYVEKDPDSFLLSRLITACRQVTDEEPKVCCFPGYTDTAVAASTLGNPNCMSYGPGDLERAHKPDEFVPCEDILRCEEVLYVLARNMLFDAT